MQDWYNDNGILPESCDIADLHSNTAVMFQYIRLYLQM